MTSNDFSGSTTPASSNTATDKTGALSVCMRMTYTKIILLYIGRHIRTDILVMVMIMMIMMIIMVMLLLFSLCVMLLNILADIIYD